MRHRIALAGLALVMLAPPAFAQPTATPAATPAPTTAPGKVPTLTDAQTFAGSGTAGMAPVIDALTADTNASIKLERITGVDGSAGGAQYLTTSERAGDVVAVLSYVTASGAAATKALLAPTTDYVLASDGRIEMVTNQSANTLLVFFHRK